MSNLGFFENMIDSKLLNLHTAFLAKVLSSNGTTAKIQPLGYVKEYGKDAIAQSPLSGVPILKSGRYKLSQKTLKYMSGVKVTKSDGYVTSVTPEYEEITVAVPTAIGAGDVVLCVCCDRDITEAKKGNNTTPAIGHHSQSDAVIVGAL